MIIIHEPSDFKNKLVSQNGHVRVGYKCFTYESQLKSALYFNICHNFHPVYTNYESIKLKKIEGYILEFSFKKDLVNDFCPKGGIYVY